LAAEFAGITASTWTEDRKRFGHLLESFVLQQLMIQANGLETNTRLWHYRDKDQVEVDCVLTQGNRTWGIEVKAAASVKPSDADGLRRLASQAGTDFQGGVVLYDGNSVLPLDRQLKLHAVPISKLWEI